MIAFVAVTSVAVPTASANSTNNDTRPGWGHGDRHHRHIGPPGMSVRPTIIQRLKDREDRIVDRLEKNKHIPEPQKTNLISQIQALFDRLIKSFS